MNLIRIQLLGLAFSAGMLIIVSANGDFGTFFGGVFFTGTVISAIELVNSLSDLQKVHHDQAG